jgi:hypothetical protein
LTSLVGIGFGSTCRLKRGSTVAGRCFYEASFAVVVGIFACSCCELNGHRRTARLPISGSARREAWSTDTVDLSREVHSVAEPDGAVFSAAY